MGGTESIPTWSLAKPSGRSLRRSKSDSSLTSFTCEDQRKAKSRTRRKRSTQKKDEVTSKVNNDNRRNSFSSTSTEGTTLSLPCLSKKNHKRRNRKPKSKSSAGSSTFTETPSSWSKMAYRSKSDTNFKVEDSVRATGPSQKKLSLYDRELPHSFACNPIMVNYTRSRLGFDCLQRSTRLDMIAQKHARDMASWGRLFSFVEQRKRQQRLQDQLCNSGIIPSSCPDVSDENSNEISGRVLRRESSRRVLAEGDEDEVFFKSTIIGENIQCGSSIVKMHHQGLTKSEIGMNITDSKYREMGMGTAWSEKTGELYMCQLFR